MLHIGLDVHKENTVWHAIDGAGLQRGRGELPTREGALGTFLQGHTEKAKFYLEAGTASAWLYRLIAAAGHAAVVVDPNRNRAIATSSKKTAKHDAPTLATLGRANLYEPVYMRTEQTDASRRMLTAQTARPRPGPTGGDLSPAPVAPGGPAARPGRAPAAARSARAGR